MNLKYKKLKLVVAISVTLGLSACGDDRTAQDYIADGQSSINSSNYEQAVVQLKNAVTLAPKDAEARSLLGKSYLQLGDYVSAKKELLKSIELGIDLSEVSTSLVQTYSKLNDFDEVYKFVNEASSLNDEDYQLVVVFAGITSVNENKISIAQDYFQQAISLNESNPYSVLAKAYLAYTNEQYKQGLEHVETLLMSSPQITESLLLKGYLLMSIQDASAASESFGLYLKQHPKATSVILLEINSLILAEEIESAEKKVDYVLKNYKGAPLAKQFKAQIAFKQKNYELALDFSEQAISGGLNYRFTRLLAGISAYKLDRYELSYQYLSGISDSFAKESGMQRLFAFLQLKLGRENEALESIENFDDITNIDGDLFAETAMQLARSGSIKKAKELLSRANELDDGNVVSLLQEGFLKLQSADISGIKELEKAIETDKEAANAWLTIALAHVQNNDLEKALQAAQEWQKISPADGLALKGVIYIRVDQLDKALLSLTEALEIEPTHLGAQMNLIKASMKLNQNDIALVEAKKILANNANSLNAMVLIINLLNADGKIAEAKKIVHKHMVNNSELLAPKIAMAMVHRFENKPSEAIKLLVSEKERLNSRGWQVLGNSQLQAFKFKEALETFSQWKEQQPEVLLSWLKIIGTLDMLNRNQQALDTIESAEKVFIDNERLLPLKLHYQIQLALVSEANQTLAKLKSKGIYIPLKDRMEGELALINKRYEKAEELLASYYQASPSMDAADSLSQALWLQGKTIEAGELLKAEFNKGKKSYKGLFILARFYSKTEQYNEAEKYFIQVIQTKPNNIIALNNLALLKYRQKSIQEALLYGRKAFEVAPNHPNVIDTLGWIEFNGGDKGLGKKLIEKAYKLAPESDDIKEHYMYTQGYIK